MAVDLDSMSVGFNPLFIGSKDATPTSTARGAPRSACFNPLFIGSKDATWVGAVATPGRPPFQSPFHRVKGCNRDEWNQLHTGLTVSIPFSSGQRMQPGLPVGRDEYLESFNPLFIGSKDATST